MITFDDFSKMELRTGKVLEANAHPDADKLYVLKVDIGEKHIQLVAGIRLSYTPDEIIGKSVVVLTNLEPKILRGVESQGMILAAQSKDGVTLLVTDRETEPGSVIR